MGRSWIAIGAWAAVAGGLTVAALLAADATPRPIYSDTPNVPGYVLLAAAAVALGLAVAGLVRRRRPGDRVWPALVGTLAGALLLVAILGPPALRVRADAGAGSDADRRLDTGGASLLGNVAAVPAGDRRYVRLDDELVVLGPRGVEGRLPLGRRGPALVGPDGRVLTVADGEQEVALYGPPRDDGGATTPEPEWTFAGRDLRLLALDGDTAVVQQGRCSFDADDPCDGAVRVLGVRGGEVAWSRPADGDLPLLYSAGGGPVNAGSEKTVAAAPPVGLSVTDGELVGRDGSGRAVWRGGAVLDPREDAVTLALAGETVVVLRGDRDTTEPTVVTPGQPPRTGRPVPAAEPAVRGATVFLSRRTLGEDAVEVTAITASSTGTRLPGVRGIPDFAEDAAVGGTGGRYRMVGVDGRVRWTTRVSPADPTDRPLGTGVASVAGDTVAVYSTLPRRYRWRALTERSERVTLLDAADGRSVRTWVAPDDQRVVQLLALPGHRALVLLADGDLVRLGGS